LHADTLNVFSVGRFSVEHHRFDAQYDDDDDEDDLVYSTTEVRSNTCTVAVGIMTIAIKFRHYLFLLWQQ
jgi:hypothetical protein